MLSSRYLSLLQSLQDEQRQLFTTFQTMMPNANPINDGEVLFWLNAAKQSESQALLTLAQRLERVDAALCSVNCDLYGICSDCEAPIESAILDADPAEPRCASCRTQDHYHHNIKCEHTH